MDNRTLKKRVEEEIQKGIDKARKRGVIIPDRDPNVIIVPIPVEED